MQPRTAVLTIVLAITVPAFGKPPEKPDVKVTELPAVNPGDGFVFVSDINEKGTAVGGSAKTNSGSVDDVRIRPIVWTEKGVLTELSVISTDGVNGGVRTINEHGRMAGVSHVPGLTDFGTHGVLFDKATPTDLGALPGDANSFANRMNKDGTIVGFSGPDPFFFGGSTACVWDKKGNISSLGRLPGDFDSEAYGINDKGVAVGASGDLYFADDGLSWAVYWDKSGIHALPGRMDDVYTTASAINDMGVIVGAAAGLDAASGPLFPFAFPTVPVRWVKGKIEELPLLPGDNAGAAWAINEGGTIVGESAIYDDFGFPEESHPVVWVDGKPIALNSLVADVPGWVFTRAAAINKKGQIVGFGVHDGIEAGFLLTPQPGTKFK